ncbi:hypothetical protein LTR65_008949 [Meristemomyces frigidus]
MATPQWTRPINGYEMVGEKLETAAKLLLQHLRPIAGSDLAPEAPNARLTAFCHLPCRMMHPDLDPKDPQSAIKCVSKLILLWERVLVRLEDAWFYDGTPKGAEDFKQTTALTPEEFAQAYLESKGKCGYRVRGWRDGNRGQDVTVALMGGDGEWGVWTKTATELCEEGGLRRLISPGPDDSHHMQTKQAIVRMWTTQLTLESHAFAFTGDWASAEQFRAQTQKWPEDYGLEWLAHTFPTGSGTPFKPTVDCRDLVRAMMEYWAYCIRTWRRHHKTRREVETVYAAEQLAVEGKCAWEVGTPHILARELKRGDPLARLMEYGGHPRHRRWALLYAKSDIPGHPPGSFGYATVVCLKCHEDCPKRRITKDQIVEGTMENVDVDIVAARAVVREWESVPEP